MREGAKLYAVFETGGKQYRVTEGEVVFLERLDGEPGSGVVFDKVLSCSNETETEFGRPYLDDASVEGKILGHGKNKKLVVFKYKSKKGYRKKKGHRQPYTKVRIERIASGKYGVAVYEENDFAPDVVAEAEDAGAEAVVTEVETADADDNDDAGDAAEIDGGSEAGVGEAEASGGEAGDADSVVELEISDDVEIEGGADAGSVIIDVDYEETAAAEAGDEVETDDDDEK